MITQLRIWQFNLANLYQVAEMCQAWTACWESTRSVLGQRLWGRNRSERSRGDGVHKIELRV